MSAPDDEYLLLWKGRQTGPFSLEQIREKLHAGEISRIHQLNTGAGWQLLDELLEKARLSDVALQYAAEAEMQRAAEQRFREEELTRHYESRLSEERLRQAQDVGQSSPAHLHSREDAPSAPPPFTPSYSPASSPPMGDFAQQTFAAAPPPPFPDLPSRTSGFAITAFILSLCNFIPLVNLVSWILAIIFGHIALSRIRADPSLKGRGLALAGLIISYVSFGLGFIYGFYVASTR